MPVELVIAEVIVGARAGIGACETENVWVGVILLLIGNSKAVLANLSLLVDKKFQHSLRQINGPAIVLAN